MSDNLRAVAAFDQARLYAHTFAYLDESNSTSVLVKCCNTDFASHTATFDDGKDVAGVMSG